MWPLAWFTLAPTLALTRGTGARRGALTWAFFGLGFFATLLWWVSIAGVIAWALLLVLQVSFVTVFGALWGAFSARSSWVGRVALASGAWASIEFLRSVFPVFGFTWGQLSQSQHDVFLLGWASLGGGVVFGGVIAGFNAALAELADPSSRSRRAVFVAALAVVVIGVGALTTIDDPETEGTAVRVAVVQGNVDPATPQDFDKDLRILTRHVELTEAIDEDVDLVVWSESAVAIDPDSPTVAPLLQRAATAVDAPMIVGGTDSAEGNRYKVMTFLVSPSGKVVDRYQKTHLVPFGEYVPARHFLDWAPILDQVPLDAIPGDEATIFNTAGIDIAPVLSFEGDFGSLVRGRIAEGGRLLIVATNTSTWRESWVSAQHVAFSQVRSVENGVPVIHAALSGISAVIESDGRVTRSLPLYEEGTIVEDIYVDDPVTLYATFGDWILAAFVILCVVAWARSARKVASPDA